EPGERVPVPDMAGISQGRPAALGDLGRHLLAGILLPAHDHDVRSRVRETKGHGTAEPAGRAGDQGDLAGEASTPGRRHHSSPGLAAGPARAVSRVRAILPAPSLGSLSTTRTARGTL